jgi:hypothetical protein
MTYYALSTTFASQEPIVSMTVQIDEIHILAFARSVCCKRGKFPTNLSGP